MAVEVRKVETPADLTRFLRLPFSLYRNDPHWVPPLELERRRFLNPAKNPFFEHADVEHFLAYNAKGQAVGRVSAVLDHAHNDFYQEKTGFFGLMETVDDSEVVHKLLDTTLQWCRQRNLRCLRGPMNLSTNHECGLLVEGFDTDPVIGMPYNPPYYAGLLESWGLRRAKDLLSLKVVQMDQTPEYMRQAVAKIMRRGRFTLRPFRPDRFWDELDKVWNVYNDAWSRNWGFVPMDRREFMFAAGELKPLLIPELCMVAEVQGEPAGFSLSIPDFNQTLKKMKGRLFPFGIFYFLFGRKKANIIRTLTLGVKSKFRRLGMDLVMIERTYQWGIDNGIILCDQSWVLEDNTAMLQPILRLGGTVYKRHRIYERPCTA